MARYSHGDVEGALDTFRRHDTAKARFNCAVISYECGDIASTLVFAAEAIERDAYFAAASLLRATALYVDRRFEDCESELTRTLLLMRDNCTIDYTQLGFAYQLHKYAILTNRAMARQFLANPAANHDLDTASRVAAQMGHKHIFELQVSRMVPFVLTPSLLFNIAPAKLITFGAQANQPPISPISDSQARQRSSSRKNSDTLMSPESISKYNESLSRHRSILSERSGRERPSRGLETHNREQSEAAPPIIPQKSSRRPQISPRKSSALQPVYSQPQRHEEDNPRNTIVEPDLVHDDPFYQDETPIILYSSTNYSMENKEPYSKSVPLNPFPSPAPEAQDQTLHDTSTTFGYMSSLLTSLTSKPLPPINTDFANDSDSYSLGDLIDSGYDSHVESFPSPTRKPSLYPLELVSTITRKRVPIDITELSFLQLRAAVRKVCGRLERLYFSDDGQMVGIGDDSDLEFLFDNVGGVDSIVEVFVKCEL